MFSKSKHTLFISIIQWFLFNVTTSSHKKSSIYNITIFHERILHSRNVFQFISTLKFAPEVFCSYSFKFHHLPNLHFDGNFLDCWHLEHRFYTILGWEGWSNSCWHKNLFLKQVSMVARTCKNNFFERCNLKKYFIFLLLLYCYKVDKWVF